MPPIAMPHARLTDLLTSPKGNTPKRSKSWPMYASPCDRPRRTTWPNERSNESSNSISTKTSRPPPTMQRGVGRRHLVEIMPTRARSSGMPGINGLGIALAAHRPRRRARGASRPRSLRRVPSRRMAGPVPRGRVRVSRRRHIISSSNNNQMLPRLLLAAIIIRCWVCHIRQRAQTLGKPIIRWLSNTTPIKMPRMVRRIFLDVSNWRTKFLEMIRRGFLTMPNGVAVEGRQRERCHYVIVEGEEVGYCWILQFRAMFLGKVCHL
mmetsp:Transcript_34574/g.62215  ORF Transcript_34574/g.62215 Transcript_34574/m.62215 type:complete len:265 (-) Transcript_34574:89-883(-)